MNKLKLKILLVAAMISIFSVNASAVEFDVWRTGISLAEMISVAKNNDIPLTTKGISTGGNRFNPVVMNDHFYKSSRFQYFTELLGKRCMVFLLTTDEDPKWLYEIEVDFAGAAGDQAFRSHLLNMLKRKYGAAQEERINYINHHVWYPDKKSKITLQQRSQPKIKYIDLDVKNYAKKQRSYQYQDDKHGYSQKDASKF